MGAPAKVSSAGTAMRRFEIALLRGDAEALDEMQSPLAACVARGDLQPVLDSPVAIAHLSSTRPSLSGYDVTEILAVGVALLIAFVRNNWGGSRPCSHESVEGEEEAALRLTRDGEDVSVALRSAKFITSARVILIDGLPGLLDGGMTLAPWWAARVALAHHAVLSAATPTLQAEIFSSFARFLGTDAAKSRYMFGNTMSSRRSVSSPVEAGIGDDEWDLPVMDGFAEEDDDFCCVLPVEGEPLIESEIPLAVLAHIELALAQKAFYDAEGAACTIRRATDIAGLDISVSGELGMRTKFQSKPTAQLIARAYQQLSEIGENNIGRELFTGLSTVFPRGDGAENEGAQLIPLPKNIPVNDSDVLGYIKLAEHDGGNEEEDDESEKTKHAAEIENLTPLDQALVLAHAGIVGARNAAHLLTDQQMAPYVNLVLKNEKSIYGTSSLVQIKALVMRVSFESDRGRYLERCMTQMESVASFIDDDMQSLSEQVRNFAVAERAALTFASGVPPNWQLRKQLAISLGNIGLVKAAMEIFKDLGFWDELVDCHRLVGNLGAAESLVRSQLQSLDDSLENARKCFAEASTDNLTTCESRLRRAQLARDTRRPRLLCVLGDVLRDTSYLEAAWKESGMRYSRAKRGLGRFAIDRGNWKEAVDHFQDALAINPLFPDIWFSYGCAAMEIGDSQTAAEAFTHVIRQRPDYGEGWNNLAKALCDIGRKKEGLKAICECARIMRESWRVWDNVLLLAHELKSTMDILRAIERLLDIRGRDANFEKPLCTAVYEVIRMATSDDRDQHVQAASLCRRLVKVLGKATSIVSTNASVWKAYSELHEIVPQAGGIRKAFDCRLKQVRVMIAKADWYRENRKMVDMVVASCELCRLAVVIGERIVLRATMMHLDSIVQQMKQDFSHHPAFQRILDARLDIQNALRECD